MRRFEGAVMFSHQVPVPGADSSFRIPKPRGPNWHFLLTHALEDSDMELSGFHEEVSQRHLVVKSHPQDDILTKASDYTVKTHFFF